MAIAYIVCFLLVLQVVSSNHSPRSIETTEKPQETTTDSLVTLSTISDETTTPETDSPSPDNFTIPDSTETTTDASSNATISTTEVLELKTFVYVLVSDEPTTEPAQTTPPPIKNMAAGQYQPGLLSLLPLAIGLISQLRWCR